MNRVPQPSLPPKTAFVTRKTLELLPASLLQYRQTWQPLVRALPTNTYLVVTNLDNPPQNASLLRLVQQLRQQGESVYVLSVGERQ